MTPAVSSLRVIALALALALASCAAAVTPAPAPHRPLATLEARSSAAARSPPPAVMDDAERIPVGHAPMRGSAGALVTVVEFGDYQCSYCRRAEETLRALRERYGDDLRVVWRDNPLPFHRRATEAAEAARAAGAQGKFWEMHDLLYTNATALERPDLERYAEYLGLDLERFRRDLDAHAFRDGLQEDHALAERLGATGTPTFFINGTILVGAQPLARFTELIDAVRDTARQIQPRRAVYARMTANPLADPHHEEPPSPAPRQLAPDTVYRVPVTADEPARGAADALVTVVEFGDFQDPFVARAAPTLAALAQRYGAALRLVWRNDPSSYHPNARAAAEAAMEAFAQQGNAGFWRFHDTLLANQRALARADLERYAAQQQLDLPRVRAALDQQPRRAAIDADAALARQLGEDGIPTFFINGRRLVGALPERDFAALIDRALTEAQARVRAGAAPAQVYDALTAQGATAPVYLPGAAPSAPGAPAAPAFFTVAPNPRAPWRGGAHAPVTLELFGGLQDPFTARLAPTLDALLQRYGERVRLVWRNYPLAFHTHGMESAEAALEVHAQRGNAVFWQYVHALLSNQHDLERFELEQQARAVGVDLRRLRTALDHRTHAATIRADIAAADAVHAVTGTPTVLVNGRAVVGAVAIDAFVTAIDAALAAAPARPARAP